MTLLCSSGYSQHRVAIRLGMKVGSYHLWGHFFFKGMTVHFENTQGKLEGETFLDTSLGPENSVLASFLSLLPGRLWFVLDYCSLGDAGRSRAEKQHQAGTYPTLGTPQQKTCVRVC